MDDLERMLAATSGRVARDVTLAPYTTYRLGGPAALLFEPASIGDLELLARALVRLPKPPPVLLLGRGSNMVISDRGWPGIVVRIGPAFGDIAMDGDVTVGAGAPMPTVANGAARRGLAGVEFMVAIPGSVGGGVRMNAGAHDAEMAEVLEGVRVVSLEDGEVGDLPAAELNLRYRASDLDDSLVVVAATFALHEEAPDAVVRRVAEYRQHRAATQPGAAQNAGSVFKNPHGDHAGRLVEAAGLKGFRVGGACVSDIHANFFIAERGATAADVRALVEAVRIRVRDEFGVDLDPEVRFVGDFEAPTGTR